MPPKSVYHAVTFGWWLMQSVIFIFEHSESGSAGLILNKPTEHTIGSIDGLESLCPEFADNCLFMVGPCCVCAVLMSCLFS